MGFIYKRKCCGVDSPFQSCVTEIPTDAVNIQIGDITATDLADLVAQTTGTSLAVQLVDNGDGTTEVQLYGAVVDNDNTITWDGGSAELACVTGIQQLSCEKCYSICQTPLGAEQDLIGVDYFASITSDPMLPGEFNTVDNLIDGDLGTWWGHSGANGSWRNTYLPGFMIYIQNAVQIEASGFYIANDVGVSGDGIETANIHLYDADNNLIATELITVPTSSHTGSIPFSTTYSNIDRFNVEILTVFTGGGATTDLQLREFGLFGDLSEVCGTSYRCASGACYGDDGQPIQEVDVEAIPGATVVQCQTLPPCHGLGYSGSWDENPATGCQTFTVDTVWFEGIDITGTATVTLTDNTGSGFTQVGNTIEQPRVGDVAVSVDNNAGCVADGNEVNEKDITETIWIEPTAITTQTNATVGQTVQVPITPDPAGLYSGITLQATNDPTGGELVQARTTEVVRMRRGTTTDPNTVLLDDGAGGYIPITNTACDPRIQYSIEIGDSGALEDTDGYRAFFDWYDSGGAVIGSVDITGGDVINDNPAQPYTDTLIPPVNADGYKMRVEGWTNSNNEWIVVYVDGGNTFTRQI